MRMLFMVTLTEHPRFENNLRRCRHAGHLQFDLFFAVPIILCQSIGLRFFVNPKLCEFPDFFSPYFLILKFPKIDDSARRQSTIQN